MEENRYILMIYVILVRARYLVDNEEGLAKLGVGKGEEECQIIYCVGDT